MLPTLESLIYLRGAKQLADLDLRGLAKSSGIDEATLKANPSLFAEAMTTYLEGNLAPTVDKPKDQTPE